MADTNQQVHALAVERTKALSVDQQPAIEAHPLAGTALYTGWRESLLSARDYQLATSRANDDLSRRLEQVRQEIHFKDQAIAELRRKIPPSRLDQRILERKEEPSVARLTVTTFERENELMRRKLPTLDGRQASGLESGRSSSQTLSRLPNTIEVQVLLQADLDDRRNRDSSWVADSSMLLDQVRELSAAEHLAAGRRMSEVHRASQGLEASQDVARRFHAELDRNCELEGIITALKDREAILNQAIEALRAENVSAERQLAEARVRYEDLQAENQRLEEDTLAVKHHIMADLQWARQQKEDIEAHQKCLEEYHEQQIGSLRIEMQEIAKELERVQGLSASRRKGVVTATEGQRGGDEERNLRPEASESHEIDVDLAYEPARISSSRLSNFNEKHDATVDMVHECNNGFRTSEVHDLEHCSGLTAKSKGRNSGGRTVATGTPGRRVAAGLNMPNQKLRGVDVADHLTALDQFKLGSPLQTPSPRKRGPRSAKGTHDGQHTPRSRHSPYSREARPSRYGRVGDMGEDCDADDEEVPRRNRERPRSHPTRSRPLRRAKFEDVNDMDDDYDYDYDDYNDYDDDGNDVEPKTPVSRIARRFLQEKIAPGALYAPQTMKKNFNNLVLGLILRGMGIQLVYHVVALEPVSDEELDAFRRNPRSHGPDLEDLRLDTNGLATTDELSGSAWNQRVAKLLCGKVKEITDRDGGDGRFGVVDADRIKRGVDTRLGRMYRLIASVVPQAGEDVVDAIARFREAHQAYNDQRRVTTSRQTKALARLRYAGVLRTACRVSNKPEALAYWSYVMRAVEALGFEGMSDEETDYEEIEHDSGVVTKRRYHKVLNPVWRRPELRDLFAKVDEAPALARMYFDKRAGAKTPRVRVDEASGQAPPKRIPKALYDPVWLEAQGELVELMLELTDDPFEIFQADAWAEESHMRYPSALNTALSKCRWSKPEEKEGAQSNNGDRTGLTGHLQGTIESSYDLAVLPNRIWRMVDCCLLESEPGVVLVGVSPWTHSPSPQVNCRTAVQDRRPQLGKLENAKDLEEAGRAGLSLRPISLNDSIEDRRQGQEQVHPHLVETSQRTEELAKSIFVEKSDTTFGDERDEDEKPWELKEPVGLLADYLCGEDVFGDAPAPSLRTTSATLRSMSTHAKDKDPSRLGPRSSLIKELLHRVEAFGAWPDHEEEELHLQPHPQRARSLRDEYIEVLTPRFIGGIPHDKVPVHPPLWSNSTVSFPCHEIQSYEHTSAHQHTFGHTATAQRLQAARARQRGGDLLSPLSSAPICSYTRTLVDRWSLISPFLMSHRVLAISEIGLLVCEALDRRSLGRLARVSRFWRTVAEDVLWRDRLTGMQPLLASMPMGAYQWDLSRTMWNGRVMTGMDIYFHLSPDELRDVLERSKFVRHINFDYRNCVVDLVIFMKLSRLAGSLSTLFPALRSISITMPKRYIMNFTPRRPPVLARLGVGTVSLSLHVRRLLVAFSQVPNVFVGSGPAHPSVISPHNTSAATYPNVLHFHEVPVDTLLHIMCPGSPRNLRQLRVDWPLRVTQKGFRDLIDAISDVCSSLSHLEIRIDNVVSEDGKQRKEGGRMYITPGLFLRLSPLRELTHLDIEGALRSHMSDADWVIAVRPWPLLERLHVVPRTLRPHTIHSTLARVPRCTMQAVLDIVAACPRLTALGLPGIDCATLPSCEWTQSAQMVHRPQSLYPLRSLCVSDSPVNDPGALGLFLSQAFPGLARLSYGECACHHAQAAQSEAGKQAITVVEPGSGGNVDRWDQVRRIMHAL
ncbi:uncharacterized protein SCHCODRAFT_01170147 [Schizophyllum commune H4-8]|uniref:F-box domain-containing protein n=1 Tax=Schizophyllum commune (strain H4-8 / FGSC 9210) TaxID=578458 RepID=D8Q2E8_SCHCM|nr:uncharacterized protein SCHCODRAFT_01170147 [Schizophyllum commune H4-8]KAI5895837.1 hypothetical protein SCHCODRAFT_01170147 [Schizophyllum commune H4-8]